MISVSSATFATDHYNRTASLLSTKTRPSAVTATQQTTRNPAVLVVELSIPGALALNTTAATGTRNASSAKSATRKSALVVLFLKIVISTVLRASRMHSPRDVQGVANLC